MNNTQGTNNSLRPGSVPAHELNEETVFQNQGYDVGGGLNPNPSQAPAAATMEALKTLIRETIWDATCVTSQNEANVVKINEPATREVRGIHDSTNGSNLFKAIKAFTSMNPDIYDGTGGPDRAAYWFFHVERTLENINCSEIDKVHIATLQFRGGASAWWESSRLSEHPELNWRMFKTSMMERFFPAVTWEEKLNKSDYPKAENLNVSRRMTKLHQLPQYPKMEVPINPKKMRHFPKRKRPTINPEWAHYELATWEQYDDVARRMGVMPKETDQRTRKKGKSQYTGQTGFKRPEAASQQGLSELKSGLASSSQGFGQNKDPLTCYNCGEQGHMSRKCTKPRRRCFTCKKEGHMRTYCPQNKGTSVNKGTSMQSRKTSTSQDFQASDRSDELTHVPSTLQDEGITLASSFQGQGRRLLQCIAAMNPQFR